MLRHVLPLFHQARRRISALYVTGDKAKDTYAVLTPYMEFSKTLISEQDELRDNIKRRRMNLSLDDVIRKYEVFRAKESLKAEVELKRDVIAKELRELQKENVEKSTLDAKKQEGIQLRNSLKDLRNELYPIEDDFVHSFLHLPNSLDRATPTDELKVIYRQGLPATETSQLNHLDRKDLIDYRDPTCFYLMKEAAHFDYYTPINCVKNFLDKNFIQFVNPDFARTLLLEGITTDLNRVEQVIEEDIKQSNVNLLHLVGGGSTASFLGFITKLTIFPTLLPLRFIASGREYIVSDEKQSSGLYTAAQSNTVQTFIATKDEAELNQEFETTLGLVVDIFHEFETHFRIVYLPAHQLSEAECLRASIQMFSPFHQNYVEVGHLSNYSNYVSKRLLFNYKEGKAFKFPYVAAGPVLNVTKILACLIESQCPLTVPFSAQSRSKNKEDAIKKFKNLFT